MERKREVFVEKLCDTWNQSFKPHSISAHENEVIRVPHIISCPELVFYELVKLVHVDIDEELRGEVAEREASAGFR